MNSVRSSRRSAGGRGNTFCLLHAPLLPNTHQTPTTPLPESHNRPDEGKQAAASNRPASLDLAWAVTPLRTASLPQQDLLNTMRLWSIHPMYLDPQGLVALWREALLAQAVLREETRGYRNHPQLERFKQHPTPLAAIARYLQAVHAEATRRGYTFDAHKIRCSDTAEPLPVTTGQLQYEWTHLMRKLQTRNPTLHEQWLDIQTPETHPLFTVHRGPIEAWERP